jgi:hypothetical protein
MMGSDRNGIPVGENPIFRKNIFRDPSVVANIVVAKPPTMAHDKKWGI